MQFLQTLATQIGEIGKIFGASAQTLGAILLGVVILLVIFPAYRGYKWVRKEKAELSFTDIMRGAKAMLGFKKPKPTIAIEDKEQENRLLELEYAQNEMKRKDELAERKHQSSLKQIERDEALSEKKHLLEVAKCQKELEKLDKKS